MSGLSKPVDVTVGRDGEIFIVGNDKHQITKFDNNGVKIVIVGRSGSAGTSISDFHLPENAPLAFVSSVSALSDTELIVADTYNHMIKRVNIPAKSITPLPVGSALSYPRGTIVVDDEVYFADYGNHCVRKINSNGVMHHKYGTV